MKNILSESLKAYAALINSYLSFCQSMFNIGIQVLEVNIESDPANAAKNTDFFNGFMTGYKKAMDDVPKTITNSFNKEPANFYV